MQHIRVEKCSQHETDKEDKPIAHQTGFVVFYLQLVERDKKIMRQTEHRHEQITHGYDDRITPPDLTIHENRQMVQRVRHLIPYHDKPQKYQ